MTITTCPLLPCGGRAVGEVAPHTPSGAGRGPALHQYRTPVPDRPEKGARVRGWVVGWRRPGLGGLALRRQRLATQVVDRLLLLWVAGIRGAPLDRHIGL